MKRIKFKGLTYVIPITAFLLLSGCLVSETSKTVVPNQPDPGIRQPSPDSGQTGILFSVSSTSGVVPLEIDFASSQHSEISEYRWDFGDGITATGPGQTHTFVNAGIYPVNLAITLNDGTRFSAERSIDAFASISNSDVIVPGTALFFDSFEYAADRDDSGVVSTFQSQGWNLAKTQQVQPNRHPLGYLYTTDTVLGYNGPMPGAGSDRVLAMEALPTTLGRYSGPDTFWGDMQTDFYLEYGQVDGPAGAIPADVWFQFWMYTTPQTLGGKHGPGGFARGMKFLYACNGSYGCQTESWMVTLGSTSQNPNWIEFSSGLGEPVPDLFLQLRGNEAVWTPGHYAGDQFGHTDTSEWIVSERWHLIKMHIDTSGSQGSFEAWIRPLGGKEVKVAQHIGGVTPGFVWPLTTGRNGHRVLRMPTTVGSRHVVENYGKLSYDHTIYLDDFTIAESESDLPRYPY